MSSTIAVHVKRKRCTSCRGHHVNFSSPIFGRGDFADIVIGYAPCKCRGAK